jgi:hypothetical protein
VVAAIAASALIVYCYRYFRNFNFHRGGTEIADFLTSPSFPLS